MKVRCDNCGRKFNPEPRKREIKKGIKEVYLQCPRCDTIFHSYYENSKVKKLINKNIKLQQDYNKNRDSGIIDKIKENKKLIIDEQKAIRKKLIK